jgi:hypothetical protein
MGSLASVLKFGDAYGKVLCFAVKKSNTRSYAPEGRYSSYWAPFYNLWVGHLAQPAKTVFALLTVGLSQCPTVMLLQQSFFLLTTRRRKV